MLISVHMEPFSMLKYYMSDIYQVYVWYMPEINDQYNIECVRCVIVRMNVQSASSSDSVRAVLCFQKAKGATDMPIAHWLWRVAVAIEEKRDSLREWVIKWERLWHTQVREAHTISLSLPLSCSTRCLIRRCQCFLLHQVASWQHWTHPTCAADSVEPA